MQRKSNVDLPHVLIVGGGFAGLSVARGLAGAAVKITLIDRCNYHLFQPLLYQVATAGLSAPDIATPLRQILSDCKSISVLLGAVVSIDAAAQRLQLEDGQSLAYDYLVLAPGTTHTYFGHDDWAAFAPGLKTLEDALGIRRRLLIAFERAEANPAEREPWLNFVIVGGGPTGVELAGTLAEVARHTLRHDFRNIDPTSARVHLIEAGERVLAGFPLELSRKADAQLKKLGVEVHTGCAVQGIDAAGVQLGEQRIEARTVLWAAGVAASPLARMLNVPLDRVGRAIIDSDLRIPGHEDIFVIGDLAALHQDGKPVPGLAGAAKQMGEYAARAIRADLAGKRLPAFHYRHAGSLATIGRSAAVADLKHMRLSGFPAWLFWLLVHIFFLIGFRNRLIVMIDWARAYWTYQRSARIILNPPEDMRPFK
jgi:NADH dehydrogenase